MISKVLSLLAALGLVASVTAKVNPTVNAKGLGSSVPNTLQADGEVQQPQADGQPLPPPPA